MKRQKPRTLNTILKNKIVELTLTNFNTYYKAAVNKNSTGKRIDKQINGLEERAQKKTHINTVN